MYEAGPPSPDARDGQAGCYLNMAFVARAGKQPAEALRLLAEAAKIQTQLVREYPAISRYRRQQAEIVYLAAVIHVDQGALAEARYGYEEVQAIREQLVREFPENLEYLRVLGTTLDELAEVLLAVEPIEGGLGRGREGDRAAADGGRKGPRLASVSAQLERASRAPSHARAEIGSAGGGGGGAGRSAETLGWKCRRTVQRLAGDLAARPPPRSRRPECRCSPRRKMSRRGLHDPGSGRPGRFRQAVAAGFDKWDQVHADPRLSRFAKDPTRPSSSCWKREPATARRPPPDSPEPSARNLG